MKTVRSRQLILNRTGLVRAGFLRAGLVAAATPMLVLTALCAGCSKPLLAPSDERTPYARYDAVRSQHASQYVEDKYGRRQPNLRARLAPKD